VKVSALLDAWLALVRGLRAAMAEGATPSPPRRAFAEYIEQLLFEQDFDYLQEDVRTFEGGRGTWTVREPWPPAVAGHGRDEEDQVTTNRRWAEDGVVLCRRGGLLATEAGQVHYNRLTWRFFLRMGDYARGQRLETLRGYLGAARAPA